jgi:hypothetical protein
VAHIDSAVGLRLADADKKTLPKWQSVAGGFAANTIFVGCRVSENPSLRYPFYLPTIFLVIWSVGRTLNP